METYRDNLKISIKHKNVFKSSYVEITFYIYNKIN